MRRTGTNAPCGGLNQVGIVADAIAKQQLRRFVGIPFAVTHLVGEEQCGVTKLVPEHSVDLVGSGELHFRSAHDAQSAVMKLHAICHVALLGKLLGAAFGERHAKAGTQLAPGFLVQFCKTLRYASHDAPVE